MESPVSQTPNHGKAPGEIADVQNYVMYFGSYRVERDSNSEKEVASSPSDNASSSSASTTEEDENSNKIKNHSYMAQETSDQTQCLSENSVSDHGSVSGHQFFVNEGEEHASNTRKDCNVELCKPEILDAGNLNPQPSIQSLSCFPSTPNFVCQLPSNPVFYVVPSFVPSPHYNYGNCQLRETTNNGLYSTLGYGTTKNDLTSNQQEIDTTPEEESQLDLSVLLEILETGDKEQIDKLILIFQGSYLSLMTDKKMFVVFQKLVDACRGNLLSFLVAEVLSWSQAFINAAFCKQGASSIVRLIKRLKKSNHAFSVTRVLSTQFLAIMTHDVARGVIQSCFVFFGDQPNKILYEKAIYHFQDLAMHKVGCRALNEIIDKIAGEQRSRLLNHIADRAAYLSDDQYGNYVVQNVLELKDHDVTARIVSSLRGRIVQLAMKREGSHVLEKCMESSKFGTVVVVMEILGNPRATLQLAQDNFGNYVIQKALKMTKELGSSELYDSLVQSLQPYHEELNGTAGGKNVLNLLRDGVQRERQSSTEKRTARREGERRKVQHCVFL